MLRECTLRTALRLKVASLAPCPRTSYTHTRLQLCSWSPERTSRRTLHSKPANFELELRKRTSCATSALKSCDSQASSWSCGSALPVLLLYLKLRFCKPELWSALRLLLLYLKLASFQPELRECTPQSTFAPRSCEFRAGAAGVHFAYYF